jgi:predicted amidohydrolase
MKIALVSLDQIWEDKGANRLKCQSYVEKASLSGAELIVFPEMTLTGFSMNIGLIRESVEDSPTLDFFKNQAKSNKISIAFGVVFEKDEKATNNLVIVDKNGNQLSNYAKIHPFSYSGESKYYLGGSELISSCISDAIVGSSICYDLRFPDIFQYLSKNCQIIVTIANWPERRIAHWLTLLQARAIENQVFMIGVNRTGTDGNNVKYVRSTVVFDPWGEKMIPSAFDSEMDIYDISLEMVKSVRDSFPVKSDRRTDLYKTLL